MVTLEGLIILASSSLVSFLVGMLVNRGRAAKARRKMERAEQEMVEAHFELLETQKAYTLLAERVAGQGTAPANPALYPAAQDASEPASSAPVLPLRTKSAPIQASAK